MLDYLLFVVTSGGPRCGALLGYTAGRSLTVGGVGGEINVLLRSSSDSEARDIDELASNADVALLDEDTGVVDRLGKPLLVDLGLQTAVQELLGGKLQDEIKFEFIVGQKTVTAHPTKEGSSFEDTLGVLGVHGQQRSGGLSKLGKGVLHSPDLALATESVLSDKPELGIKTFLLVGTTRSLECLTVCYLDKIRGKDETTVWSETKCW